MLQGFTFNPAISVGTSTVTPPAPLPPISAVIPPAPPAPKEDLARHTGLPIIKTVPYKHPMQPTFHPWKNKAASMPDEEKEKMDNASDALLIITACIAAGLFIYYVTRSR
jgi:hypothetical protein